MIYVTSDLHLGHDREFIFKPRGFSSVEEHDNAIITNWNNVVADTDDVYILGDLMLNDNKKGINMLNQLNGYKHVILGNHDTDARIDWYTHNLNKCLSIKYADVIKYGGYHFYLSHYPTMTSNLEKDSIKKCLINLYGHTHQKTNFYNEIPYMYHVGVDSHSNTPISLDNVILDIEEEARTCLKLL